MTVVENYERNGYRVQLVVDEDAGSFSPRDNDGNLFRLLGFPHRNYDIGDETFDLDSAAHECEHCKGSGEEPGTGSAPLTASSRAHVLVRGTDCTVCQGTGYVNPCYDPATGRPTIERTVAFLKAEHESAYVVPFGMIDHSGVSYYLGGGAHWSDTAGWDSGTAGFMVLLPKAVKEHMGADFEVTDEWAHEAAEAELGEYDSWARGDVFGVVIEDQNGDTVESVWGMIGYDYALESANEIADGLDEQPAKLHTLRLTDADLTAIAAALEYVVQTPCGAVYDSKATPAALDKINALREEVRDA